MSSVDFEAVSYYKPSMLWRSAFACLLLALTLQAAGQSASSGEKPDPSKQAYVFQKIFNRIRYENDGTGTRESEAVVRVQSQSGVQEFGQLIFGYSAATETLEVSYVRVRKPDGRVLETPTTGGQDLAPEILQQAPMYSDYRQRHISVVSLQAGDTLEYRTVAHMNTPIIAGQFWYEHAFPRNSFVDEDRLEIDVPKSRELKLKSPDYKYEVQDASDRRTYVWSVKNLSPKRESDGGDEADFGPEDIKPDVQMSTFTDWQQLARWYAKVVEEQSIPDDSARAKAAELTRGATTASEKVQRLYNYVALNIRYVSLSFGVGRLQPHPGVEVMRNGYGDCKDKHTLLATLLRAEGIQSDAVLIHSFRKLDPDVPSPAQFDHVISAVHVGENLVWLDTTAEVAPYGLIFYSLRNKQALVASAESGGGLRRTPAEAPVKNVATVTIDGTFSEQGGLDANIDITAQGDSDVPLRQAFRQTAPARWEDLLKLLSARWAFEGDISEVHLGPLEDTTKPFHLTYHYHKAEYFQVPNFDAQFLPLPPLDLRRPPKHGKNSESIDVGPAIEQNYKAHFQYPPNYTLTLPPNFAMTRDYGDCATTYNSNKNQLDVKRTLILRVNELPESRRSDYESFRNVAAGVVTLGFAISRPAANQTTVAAGGTPEEWRKQAATAMRRDEFSTAADLLKRVVTQEPNQQEAWDDLGLAYAGMNNHEEAVRAFRKQIEVNAFHPRANDDLGTELQQLGKFDEAVSAYRKQLEITPSDKIAHKNLGLILAEQHRDHEARPELETAAAIAPDDPEVKMALAGVYDRAGEKEKAQALMKGLTGGGPAKSGADMFAQALRDDMDVNQTLRDARAVLDQIGNQFDSGDYNRIGPSAFSAMNLVALSWARIGWANFLQGENLEAMRYLTAAWTLSQSGVVANRQARALEKEGQRDKARHTYALAAATGGDEADISRQAVLRLSTSSTSAEQEISQAKTELIQANTVKLAGLNAKTGSAQFNLIFDNSSQPERAEFFAGDDGLRSLESGLRQKSFPVKFPDVSSIKIIRRGTLSCSSAGCSMLLQPTPSLQATENATASAPQK